MGFEAHDDETAKTLAGFWRRAQHWFWSNDMAVGEVLTDHGPSFVSDAFAAVLAERRIVHRRTRPIRHRVGSHWPLTIDSACGETSRTRRGRRYAISAGKHGTAVYDLGDGSSFRSRRVAAVVVVALPAGVDRFGVGDG